MLNSVLRIGPAVALAAVCVIALSASEATARSGRERGLERTVVPALRMDREPSREGPRFFSIADVLARQDGRPRPIRPPAAGGVQVAAASPFVTPRIADDVPFGGRGFRTFGTASGPIRGQWAKVLADWSAESVVLDRCDRGGKCRGSARVFNSIALAARATSGLDRLRLVNARVNGQIRYVADGLQHGEPDVWTTPLKTLRSVGDCEDYAIAKYFVLVRAGVPKADMHIVLVRDRRAGEDHAVLAVRHDGNWWLLDNRWNTLDRDRDMAHYLPVSAISGHQVQLYAAPFAQQSLNEYSEKLFVTFGSVIEWVRGVLPGSLASIEETPSTPLQLAAAW